MKHLSGQGTKTADDQDVPSDNGDGQRRGVDAALGFAARVVRHGCNLSRLGWRHGHRRGTGSPRQFATCQARAHGKRIPPSVFGSCYGCGYRHVLDRVRAMGPQVRATQLRRDRWRITGTVENRAIRIVPAPLLTCIRTGAMVRLGTGVLAWDATRDVVGSILWWHCRGRSGSLWACSASSRCATASRGGSPTTVARWRKASPNRAPCSRRLHDWYWPSAG